MNQPSPPSPPSPPPPKSPPPPTTRPPGSPVKSGTPPTIIRGVTADAQKVIFYGTGGIGKTELCANLQQVGRSPLFIDLDQESKFQDVARVPVSSWDDLRSVLHDTSTWESFDAVVIDNLTKAEELAISWMLANVKTDKGQPASSVESYGFGKGYTYAYETFLQLLGDLDAIVRAGKQVICTAHDCTAKRPNPEGEDWIQYQPRLQTTKNGAASVRNRVKEWCDHLLFIGYDQCVTNGKAVGSGSRTIYPVEMPTHWAKSRTLSDAVVYERGSTTIWEHLFRKATS